MTAQEALDWLGDKTDFLGYLRYGMPTATKETLALTKGALPGAPAATTADAAAPNRYAAGYLLAQQHPTVAPYLVPAANFVHGLAGDDPSIQSQATAGMNRALLDASNSQRELDARRKPAQVAPEQPGINASGALQALLASFDTTGRRW